MDINVEIMNELIEKAYNEINKKFLDILHEELEECSSNLSQDEKSYLEKTLLSILTRKMSIVNAAMLYADSNSLQSDVNEYFESMKESSIVLIGSVRGWK